MRRTSVVAACWFGLTLALSAGTAAAVDPKPQEGIPFKQDAVPTEALAYQSLAALMLAGLAAYGIVLALKRYSARGGVAGTRRHLQIVQVHRLSRRSLLYVVMYGSEELLLAEHDHGLQLLSRRPTGDKPDSGATNG